MHSEVERGTEALSRCSATHGRENSNEEARTGALNGTWGDLDRAEHERMHIVVAVDIWDGGRYHVTTRNI